MLESFLNLMDNKRNVLWYFSIARGLNPKVLKFNFSSWLFPLASLMFYRGTLKKSYDDFVSRNKCVV
jgi:hypothetical protein